MVALILALVVLQAPNQAGALELPGVAVLVTRQKGLSASEAGTLALAERLSRALGEAKVPLITTPEDTVARLGIRRAAQACDGRAGCLAELGRVLGAEVVVSIAAVRILDDLAVRVTVLNARNGRSLLERSYTDPVAHPVALDAFFRRAAQDVSRVLSSPPTPMAPPTAAQSPRPAEPLPSAAVTEAPPDAPRASVEPRLLPEPSAAADVGVDVMGSPPPSLRLFTAGAAVESGLAAITLLVVGLVQSSRLDTSNGGVLGQTQGPRTAMNTEFWAAGCLGGAAVGLGVATLLLGPKPNPGP